MAKTKQVVQKKAEVKQEVLSATQQFRDLIVREAELWYDCSLLAYKLYTEREWEKEGYVNCREYVETEFGDLGVSYRVFMYRVKMGEAIVKHEITREEIANIGWSKFKEISKILLDDEFPLTEKNAKELLKEAREKSVRELQQSVREKQMMYKEELVGKKLSLKFSVFNEHVNIVEEALNTAKQVSGYDDDNMALVFICVDYLTNHITDSKAIQKIRTELEKLVKKEA